MTDRSTLVRAALASFFAAIAFGGAFSSAPAGEPWTDEKIVDLLAKSATVDTVGFAYYDADGPKIADFLAPLKASRAFAPELAEALEGWDAELARSDERLQELRLREIVVLLDLPAEGRPLIYALCRTDGDLQEVAASLREGALQADVVDDLVRVVANVDDVQRGKPDPNAKETIQAAFASTAEYPLVVAYFPSKPVRERIPAYAPPFPEAAKRLVAERASKELKWASVGFDPSGRGKIALRGQATDAQAADGIRNDAKAAVGSLMRAGRDSGFFEQAGVDLQVAKNALALATIKGQGKSLELTLDGNDLAVKAVVDHAIAAWGRTLVEPDDVRTSNALKQIVLAFHNFHDTYRDLPASGAQKLPEHWIGDQAVSWRVMILPFIEHGELWDEYKIEEPWDSENNKKLIARMPKLYRSTDPNVPADKTTYQMPLLEGAASTQERASTWGVYKDGMASTILVVESAPDQAVIWTKPDDLEIDLAKFAELVGPKNAAAFHAAMADGGVLRFREDLDAETARRLIQCADGEEVDVEAAVAK